MSYDSSISYVWKAFLPYNFDSVINRRSGTYSSLIPSAMLCIGKQNTRWQLNYARHFYMRRACCEKLLMIANEPGSEKAMQTVNNVIMAIYKYLSLLKTAAPLGCCKVHRRMNSEMVFNQPGVNSVLVHSLFSEHNGSASPQLLASPTSKVI